jgi:hypothetical protein
MAKGDSKADTGASERISKYISGIDDWRGKMLAQLRKVILKASPELVEEWKWDTPVWSLNGNVVAAAAFKDHVKLNFFKGATLKDPNRLFNAGLEAKTTRGIDFQKGDKLNEPALRELIRAAVALNAGKKKS